MSLDRWVSTTLTAYSADHPAFIAAVPLVLGETYVILNLFLRSFLVGQIGVDLFDAVCSLLRCMASF